MFLSPETFGSGCVVSRRSSQHLDECVCFLLLPVAMLLPLTTVLALYSMHSYFFGASCYCGCRHSWPATPCHALPWVLMTHCSGHSHTHFHISVATLWFLLIIWCSYLIWRSLAFIHFLLSKSSILGSGFFKPPLHWAASFLPVLPQTGSEVH